MIKVGFICEGFTEQKLLESAKFQAFLQSIQIEQVGNIINAEGSGNLLPHNIAGYINSLKEKQADTIIILTDLDEDICITKTKERINVSQEHIVVVAVKQIESWFLACTSCMRVLLKEPGFSFQYPEAEAIPFETLRKLKLEKTGSGVTASGKIKLMNILLSLGLDIQEAASHPNCPSAKYFIDKLHQIAAN
jgi:hypothetical protein